MEELKKQQEKPQNKIKIKKEKLHVDYNRLIKDIPEARKWISFWRAYPDLFIDWVKGPNSTFEFKAYQRIWLRILCRYREVFITASRGASKSFLAVLVKIIQCILYPNSRLFMTAEGKAQAQQIISQKVDELLRLLPTLKNEIDWSPGATRVSVQETKYIFKNGSQFIILGATERSRGARTTGGIVEEAAKIDGDILNEVIIPTMSISRRLADGSVHSEEVINKNVAYITSAGDKMTFAYDKLLEILVKQLTQKPQNAFCLGCSYRVPKIEGQYDENYIADIKASGTYTEEAFFTEFKMMLDSLNIINCWKTLRD